MRDRFAVRSALPVRTQKSLIFTERPLRCETTWRNGVTGGVE